MVSVSFVAPATTLPVTAAAVNYIAMQLRLQRKREKCSVPASNNDAKHNEAVKKENKVPDNIKTVVENVAENVFDAKVEKHKIDDGLNLAMLDKKVNELSKVFDAAYELMKEFDKFRNNVMKEFDKFRNNVESMADDYCVIKRKMCVVSEDMEGLGTKICGVHEVVDVLQRNQGKFLEKIKVFSDDLAELDTFFDNVASKFNLHGVPLPKVRGKRKITIIR